MNIVNRIRNILIQPRNEWEVIKLEQDNPTVLLIRYVLPLSLIGTIAAFIGYGVIGMESVFFNIRGIKWGIWFALHRLIAYIGGYFISSFVIDQLAPSFASEKNLNRSAQLVAYSYTPVWLAGIFLIYPPLSFLGLLGLYGIYLYYLGVPVMKRTPEEKRLTYMIVSALLIIIISWFVQWVAGKMLNPILGDPYAFTEKDLKEIFK